MSVWRRNVACFYLGAPGCKVDVQTLAMNLPVDATKGRGLPHTSKPSGLGTVPVLIQCRQEAATLAATHTMELANTFGSNSSPVYDSRFHGPRTTFTGPGQYEISYAAE
jgi:hypothetical protein